MGKQSERRRKERASKKAAKEKAMKAPGFKSKYARKKAGDYPPNSPYRTVWAHLVRGEPEKDEAA